MYTAQNRRRFPRFALQPAYTPIAARTLDSETFDFEGHAYDISEGGVQFELDRAIKPGTKIALAITLPTMNSRNIGPGRAIYVFANVIWTDNDDVDGPVRIAAVFTRFARAGDQERLRNEFRTGQYRAAA